MQSPKKIATGTNLKSNIFIEFNKQNVKFKGKEDQL